MKPSRHKSSAPVRLRRMGSMLRRLRKLEDNADFRRSWERLARKIRLLPWPESAPKHWEAYFAGLPTNDAKQFERFFKLATAFVRRWKVVPPFWLLRTDQRQRADWMVLSGCWGVIPVFPWTREPDVARAFVTIRGKLRKEWEGQERKSSVTRQRAAATVFLQKYADVPYASLSGPIWRRDKPVAKQTRVEGEPPALAAIRKQVQRYRKAELRLDDELTDPQKRRHEQRDPVGYAFTMLLRAGAKSCNKNVQAHVREVRKGLATWRAT